MMFCCLRGTNWAPGLRKFQTPNHPSNQHFKRTSTARVTPALPLHPKANEPTNLTTLAGNELIHREQIASDHQQQQHRHHTVP
jgi:hypothetical protein